MIIEIYDGFTLVGAYLPPKKWSKTTLLRYNGLTKQVRKTGSAVYYSNNSVTAGFVTELQLNSNNLVRFKRTNNTNLADYGHVKTFIGKKGRYGKTTIKQVFHKNKKQKENKKINKTPKKLGIVELISEVITDGKLPISLSDFYNCDIEIMREQISSHKTHIFNNGLVAKLGVERIAAIQLLAKHTKNGHTVLGEVNTYLTYGDIEAITKDELLQILVDGIK